MICADYRGDSAARQELDSWGAGSFQARGSRTYAAAAAGRINALENTRTSSLASTRRTTATTSSTTRSHAAAGVTLVTAGRASQPTEIQTSPRATDGSAEPADDCEVCSRAGPRFPREISQIIQRTIRGIIPAGLADQKAQYCVVVGVLRIGVSWRLRKLPRLFAALLVPAQYNSAA